MRHGLAAIMTALAMICAAGAAHADPASEAAAAALFDHVLASPPALRMFLKLMPKGGDLHNHLGGSVYAEDFLSWGAAEGYCADDAGTAVKPPPCATGRSLGEMGETSPFDYARLVDALSVRGLLRGVGANEASGHMQFFRSFDRFGALSGVTMAQAMAATRGIAVGDRVGYLELTYNPSALNAHTLAGAVVALDAAGLAARYEAEIKAVPAVLAKASAELDRDEAAMRAELACGGAKADPACAVAVHYLAWGWRDLPPAQAFRSLILAFAMADHDPRFVGINIVQPEDWVIALRDYDLHMAMIRFLGAKYPRVRRTLHAGELAFGAVPPAALRDHIRKAIDAGAQRIGHGAGIAHEDDALGTMQRMAREGIAVEINLTSNDVILGVRGSDHPLALYRRLGVPVVLSTDDEGILRTDMTNEYLRAAREQGLRYGDLKTAARASLEYAFIPGASLWEKGRIGTAAAPCARSLDDAACRRFIRDNEKARLQAGLEQDYDRFERVELPRAAQAFAAILGQ